METSQLTIKKTFLVSIGIHILIFGSALALAQYSGGVLRREAAVITVSLVSSGGGAGAIRRPGAELAQRMPVNTLPSVHPMQKTLPAPVEDAKIGSASVPVAGGEKNGAAAIGQGDGPNLAAASGTDSATSGLSSAQWLQLHSAIEQVKSYPRFARERGIEGTVMVRFKVLPSGAVETVNVVKSSGASILDEASVTTVYRAAPMPFVNGWIEVPLSYVLK